MPENWKAVGPSILIVTWKNPFMYLCMYKGLYVYKSVYIYIYMFIYKITFSGSEEPFPWPGLVFIIIAVEKMPKDVPSYLLWQGNSFAQCWCVNISPCSLPATPAQRCQCFSLCNTPCLSLGEWSCYCELFFWGYTTEDPQGNLDIHIQALKKGSIGNLKF